MELRFGNMFSYVCPLCHCAVHLILKKMFSNGFSCIIFNVKQICRQKEPNLATPLWGNIHLGSDTDARSLRHSKYTEIQVLSFTSHTAGWILDVYWREEWLQVSPNIQSGFLHGISRKARVWRLRNERIYEKWELLTLILKTYRPHILSKS